MATCITHKYPRRVSVEAEKSDNAPDHRCSREQHSDIAARISKDRYDSKAEQGDPACQAVQTVGQIDCIGHANERKNGHWNRNIIRQRVKPQKRGVSDHDPAIQNYDEVSDDLAQKLEVVINSLDVIPDSENQNDRNADQECDHL